MIKFNELNTGEVPLEIPSDLELYLLSCKEKRDQEGNQKVSPGGVPQWSLECNLVLDRKLLLVRTFKVTVASGSGFSESIGSRIQLKNLAVGAYNSNLYFKADGISPVAESESELFGEDSK